MNQDLNKVEYSEHRAKFFARRIRKVIDINQRSAGLADLNF